MKELSIIEKGDYILYPGGLMREVVSIQIRNVANSAQIKFQSMYKRSGDFTYYTFMDLSRRGCAHVTRAAGLSFYERLGGKQCTKLHPMYNEFRKLFYRSMLLEDFPERGHAKLTDENIRYIINNYGLKSNKEIANHCGCRVKDVIYFCRQNRVLKADNEPIKNYLSEYDRTFIKNHLNKRTDNYILKKVRAKKTLISNYIKFLRGEKKSIPVSV